jgi:hypothetical protein
MPGVLAAGPVDDSRRFLLDGSRITSPRSDGSSLLSPEFTQLLDRHRFQIIADGVLSK